MIIFSILVLLLARLSSTQYAGTLDVNNPSCPRRHGPQLHYEWTFTRSEGHHCYDINLPKNHYFLSMKASRDGPVLGPPDVLGVCEASNCRNCTYFRVPPDQTLDNVHIPCLEASGRRYIYIGR
ncbi:uncharacterized protein LDX57_010370 [Aspergillus melleus]|uniref:uncharacterized protein n=1 Tax=Aspergillus melleus TaxID=138277 RepID=UPI001E8D9208|nr:uncharacterized protein LDX57_010370 [Aspergillus melleus]KAH8432742.1 hypothetical protein LDX57_010370 [Aspergillus melleus]